MTQWRCIREAIAARREFRTTIKNRPGRHASRGDAEIRGLFVGGTYGIFLGEPGSPEWVGPLPSFTFIGGVSGSSAVITQVNPNLNVIPRSVLTIFPSPGDPHEVEFPSPEPGAFSDLLKVSDTIADLRNEPWCRVP